MTIDEAEAAVKAAEAALHAAKDEAEKMLAGPRRAVEEAEAARLAALVDISPIRVGDIVEHQRWKKTDRIKVKGFRHSYGRKLVIIGNPLKKDGTPGVLTREYYESDKLTKVEP
jgi:hypothetical protein